MKVNQFKSSNGPILDKTMVNNGTPGLDVYVNDEYSGKAVKQHYDDVMCNGKRPAAKTNTNTSYSFLLRLPMGNSPNEGEGHDDDVFTYGGTTVIRLPFMPDYEAFTPGDIIFAGSKVSQFSTPDLLQHEKGHVTDYYRLGVINYYTRIAIPSVINMKTGIGGPHKSFYPEIRANLNATAKGYKFKRPDHFPTHE
jgi:hypothetical protein